MSRRRGNPARGHSSNADQCGQCKMGPDGGSEWIQCDTCDTWFHSKCSGLDPSIHEKLSEVKYLLFRCKLCYDQKIVTETSRKLISDIISDSLPDLFQCALRELKIGDLVHSVKQLQNDVNSLRKQTYSSVALKSGPGSYSYAPSKSGPGPSHASALSSSNDAMVPEASTAGLPTMPVVNSLSEFKPQYRKQRTFKFGTGANSVLKGIARPTPRKHLFIGRVDKSIDEQVVIDHCNSNNLGLQHVRTVSKEDADMKSFHCVFNDDIEVNDVSLWPPGVSIARFRLNDKAREWLKTLPQPFDKSLKQPANNNDK